MIQGFLLLLSFLPSGKGAHHWIHDACDGPFSLALLGLIHKITDGSAVAEELAGVRNGFGNVVIEK
jgi:hypothetical protein